MRFLHHLLLACIPVLAIGSAAWAQKSSAQLEREGYKRYALKSAFIEYTLSGATSGKEIVQFDRWGLREATRTETEVKAAGRSFPSQTEALMDGEFTYTLDRKANSATKTHNTLLTQIATTHKTKNLEEIGERTLTASGARKTGTATYLGKTCDRWEIRNLGTTMLVYKGVPLKSVTNMSGMTITKEATKFEENARIPEDRLVVPTTMRITDGGNPLEMLNKLKRQGKK